MQQQHLIFCEKILGAQKKIRWSHFWDIFTQKFKNLSTSSLDYTVNKNFRNFLFDTIQEPLPWSFQNTPYFSLSDNSSTFGAGPKFGNFQNVS